MLNNKRRRRDLVSLISLLVFCVSVQAQKRPPNYSQDDMPITSFSCQERIVGGYYADPETDCQMFHVCVNVPGIGIQDYRFLCPNDTTFDQEHQICDDWYNIDCELAAYDSFDLYRIGVDNEIKRPSIPKKPVVSNKGTPIPLGPSSTIKPFSAAAPKKNVYASVNNGISEDEQYYKRTGNSISDEGKVPNDILRGSHSSNFYDSKTKGREDLEDDYETPNVGAKRQELNPIPDTKKHKTLVRKLAGKRPVSQKTAQQNFNTEENVPKSQYNQTAFPSNKIPQKPRGNVNFNSYAKTDEDFQRLPDTRGSNLYQKINNLTEDANSQEKKQDSNRNYENTHNFRLTAKQRPAPKPTTNAPTPTEFRLPSTEYLQNIANNYQQPATVINNQLQDNSDYRNPVEYQNYNNQAYDYTYQQFNKQSTQGSPSSQKFQTVSQKYYESSSPLPEQKKSTEFQSFSATYSQPNTTVFDYYKYYQTSPSPSYQKAKNYYSTTSTTTSSPKYDPYATFQKSNEKYEEEEFLKTAPSSNLKPSDLNAIYNQKKIAYVNATLKAAYNVDPGKSGYYQAASPSTSQTNKYYQSSSSKAQNNFYQPSSASTKSNYYQPSATNSPSTYYQQTATNSPQNYYQPTVTSSSQTYNQQSATNAPQNNYYQQPAVNSAQQVSNLPQNNYYQTAPTKQNQPIATNAPQKVNYYQPQVTSTTKAPIVKQTTVTKTLATNSTSKKPNDYDYAYYDNASSSEYDQIDNVGEDFIRIQKAKN